MKPIRPLILILASLSLLGSQAYAGKDAMVHHIKHLTLDAAIKVAQTAISICRNKGANVAVTIIDRSGNIQIVLRETLAPPLTLEISRKKAYAAMNFSAPTSRLKGLHDTSIGKIDSLIFSAGGIPISAGGTILGGIGVSGAPSGKLDEECANAGFMAIKDDLEMSMQ